MDKYSNVKKDGREKLGIFCYKVPAPQAMDSSIIWR